MPLSNQDKTILRTSAGDFPLNQYCLRTNGREWKILHVSNVLSHEEEAKFLLELSELLPYGVTLWTAAIALAHDVAARGAQFGGAARVLELGSGTGMPGIVAASHGARVVQTDRNELAMSVCKRNIALNDVETIEQRVVDWTDWNDAGKYDWILGSDILYGKDMHPHLRRIFESNLAPGGRVLLSDPFRSTSFNLLEALEADGWSIKISKWSIGEESALRPIGVFELSPPSAAMAK
jgi:predicted nicotinamide N-methyase